jgi:dUTP pyrophosphatase
MDRTPIIKLLRLRPESDADIPLPRYMTPRSAGLDVYAAIENDLVLEAGGIAMIPTGFAMAIPDGYEAQIRPRSGLAVKFGVSIVNSPGTIDSDYRGEIKIGVINHGSKGFTLRRGDRIAQMVIHRAYRAKLEVVEKLDKTDRNTGGFGHTGL